MKYSLKIKINNRERALKNLIRILKHQVESEEMVVLVRSEFIANSL